MAIISQPENLAREVLAIFVADERRPGTGMPLNAIRNKFGLARPGEEFRLGITFAIDQKWIEEGNNSFLLLTDLGFKEA